MTATVERKRCHLCGRPMPMREEWDTTRPGAHPEWCWTPGWDSCPTEAERRLSLLDAREALAPLAWIGAAVACALEAETIRANQRRANVALRAEIEDVRTACRSIAREKQRDREQANEWLTQMVDAQKERDAAPKRAEGAEAERDQLRAQLADVLAERDESRRENRHACIALADAFIPDDQRSGAHLHGLPRLVAHAVEHHRWHHDAGSADYVRGVETERDAALQRESALRLELDATKQELLVKDIEVDGISEELRLRMERAERAETERDRLAVEVDQLNQRNFQMCADLDVLRAASHDHAVLLESLHMIVGHYDDDPVEAVRMMRDDLDRERAAGDRLAEAARSPRLHRCCGIAPGPCEGCAEERVLADALAAWDAARGEAKEEP